MHHNDNITVPNDPGRVNLSQFKQQMQYLSNGGFQTVTHRQIAAWLLDDKPLPPHPVALDFDDNRLNIFQNAFPIMSQFGFTGTVFTVTDLADGQPLPRMDQYPAMRWDQLLKLQDAGWCIAPHTRTHRFLTEISLTEARQEMDHSYQRVRQMTGEDTPYFAYPAGLWNEDLETIAKQIFRTTRHWFLAENPPVTHDTSPYRLPSINIAMDMTMPAFETLMQV